MRFWRRWTAKVKGILTQKQQDHDFDAEIESHLQLLTEGYLRQGMSREGAASAAHRQFGNVTLLREHQRAQRNFLSPAEWWGDIRFGLRMMMKNPGSSAAVILALALGVGMNAGVFTFINALLLRPPAVVDAPASLVEIWLHSRLSAGVQSYLPLTYPDYEYFRNHSRSLEGVLAFDGDGSQAIWNRSGAGVIVQGQLVSGNYFSLLGVNAVFGRMISNGDDQLDSQHPVVVLSYSFWERQLRADPGILGQTLVLNGAAFSVIGVAPPGFTGLLVATAPDFWAPLATQEQFTHNKDRLTNTHKNWLIAAGRLEPGIDRVKAQAEVHVLAQNLE